MARAALGWSADELARQAGIGAATVARFERERSDLIRATEAAIIQTFKKYGVTFGDIEGGYSVVAYPKSFDADYLREAAARKAAKVAAWSAARKAPKVREAPATAAPTPAPAAPASASQGYRSARETTIPLDGDAWDFLDDGK